MSEKKETMASLPNEENEKDTLDKLEKLSYEQAVAALEKTVAKLESSDLSLDDSVALFQQGMQLAKICTQRLNEIEGQISKMIEKEDGSLAKEPFDLPDET